MTRNWDSSDNCQDQEWEDVTWERKPADRTKPRIEPSATKPLFVNELKSALNACGITRSGVSDILSISRKVLEQYENGTTFPPKAHIVKLQKITGKQLFPK